MQPISTWTGFWSRWARLYHESGLPQARIAQRLRLSRQKIQRLLDEARKKGVVRIVVEPLMGIHDDMEKELEERFGLREAVVVETSASDDQSVVAREAGVGAVVDPSRDFHSTELARRLAHFLGGRAMLLPAPGVAGNRHARRAFLNDPPVARVLASARAADIAFVGIGAPRQDSILIREGSIVSWRELEALQAAGAVGDINLRFFDATGRAVISVLDARVIGLTLEDFGTILRLSVSPEGGPSFRQYGAPWMVSS